MRVRVPPPPFHRLHRTGVIYVIMPCITWGRALIGVAEVGQGRAACCLQVMPAVAIAAAGRGDEAAVEPTVPRQAPDQVQLLRLPSRSRLLARSRWLPPSLAAQGRSGAPAVTADPSSSARRAGNRRTASSGHGRHRDQVRAWSPDGGAAQRRETRIRGTRYNRAAPSAVPEPPARAQPLPAPATPGGRPRQATAGPRRSAHPSDRPLSCYAGDSWRQCAQRDADQLRRCRPSFPPGQCELL